MQKFKEARVESPVLAADLLIGHVLGRSRTAVLAHSEKIIDEDEFAGIQRLVERRIKGEPYHYITGEKEFYGLAFNVTPDVLIPRPETEILVEKALELIGGGLSPSSRFADVGTGSGCIAVAVAHARPASVGYAVDISAAALAVARENARRHNVSGRVIMVRADLLECFPCRPCLNLIISNPPYINWGDYNDLSVEVREHEPRLALLSGPSGYEIYRRLIPGSAERLVSGGYLLLELGAGQAEHVEGLVRKEGFTIEATMKDLQGIPRCIVGRKPAGRYNG